MICSIVACGDSAKEWYKVPVDFSIGVNDCLKFGHQVDNLVVVNSPIKFFPSVKNGHVDRLKIITSSKPKKFFGHDTRWRQYFPQYEGLAIKPYHGNFRKGRIYSTSTSPFIAITLAASLGATEIILWGVDFINHHAWRPGQRDFGIEFDYYRLLFEQLIDDGIKMWLGNEQSVFNQVLPIYKNENRIQASHA